MTDEVKKRLKQFGYEPSIEDEELIYEEYQRAFSEVLSECGQRKLPSALEDIVTDRAAGKFLKIKLSLGSVEEKSRIVKEILEGDVKIAYETDSEKSVTAIFYEVITALENCGKNEILAYRSVVW